MSNNKTSKQKGSKRLKPISLYPLTPEQALEAFMASNNPRSETKHKRRTSKQRVKEV